MIITSDNESAFLSSDFESELDKHETLLEPNVKGDHNALGIIDFFCKRLRLVISKKSIREGNKYDWLDMLDKFVDNYNNAPNTALEDIAPDNTNNRDAQAVIFEKNLTKSKKNRQISDLSIGDTVRYGVATQYTKSSEPQFSDIVLKVVSTKGGNIKLNNGETMKRVNLLKVNALSTKVETNIYKEAHKAKQGETEFKKSGLDKKDIIVVRRSERVGRGVNKHNN